MDGNVDICLLGFPLKKIACMSYSIIDVSERMKKTDMASTTPENWTLPNGWSYTAFLLIMEAIF